MKSVKQFAESLDIETRWHGGHNENCNHVLCQAGKFSMIYERGNLRHISIGETEFVRMIYSAVRVRDWLTIIPVISDEKVEIKPSSFKISYCASYLSDEINFQAKYSISGNSDNSITFSFEGEALNDFEKNRIGFCVLHPVEGNKGESCTIIHSNGKREDLLFPLVISPRQPFLDIKSMNWKRSGTNCFLDFYGDVFETEDQRNWTDASYKTYCTPLGNPRPELIKNGQKISQKIVFWAEESDCVGSIDNEVIKITVDRNSTHPFPMIGIGQSTRHNKLTEGEIGLIKKVEFDHYRTDICLFNDDWKIKTEEAFRESALLGYRTELALFFDDDFSDQISNLIYLLNSVSHDLAVVLLFHKTAPVIPDILIEQIVPRLKKSLPGVKICCGTNANFVQLNRNRSQSLLCDSISYSIHPQEHASDNLTLIENLQAQSYTVGSTLRFAGNKSIRISPVNIQRRFNANKSNFEELSVGNDFPPQVDTRLMSLFGGCWIAGSLKYLIESGAAAVTLLETVGERGIIQGDYDSRWRDDFQSVKGMMFPVYAVLKYILQYKKSKVAGSRSSHPIKVDSLAFYDGNAIKLILMNFTSVRQQVHIEPVLKQASIRILNDETYPYAVSDEDWLGKTAIIKVHDTGQLSLDPFSITFIEG
jgi:hypothetical protein